MGIKKFFRSLSLSTKVFVNSFFLFLYVSRRQSHKNAHIDDDMPYLIAVTVVLEL